MKHILKLFLITFCFFIISCDDSSQNDLQKQSKNATSNEITLTSYDGRTLTFLRTKTGFKLKGDENKVILFDLFGTFCPPCKEEAPYLGALQNELNDKLIIVGLAYFEKKNNEKLKEFAKKYNANYFLTNDDNGNDLIETILDDINYQDAVLLPMKVMLSNGKYQDLTNPFSKTKSKFYLGKIPTNTIKEDILKALNKQNNENKITKNDNLQNLFSKQLKFHKIITKNQEIHAKQNAFLTISNNQANGSSGCNNFFGEVIFNRDLIEFKNIGATKMYCENYPFEDELFKNLKTFKIQKQNDEIWLINDDISIVLSDKILIN